MSLIPWAIVGLLIGALVILWNLAKARVEGLQDDLDYERTENAEVQGELNAEIAELRALKEPPLKPPVQYKPTHRRPWPTPELKHHGELAVVSPWTPACEKLALARLGMDCALCHPIDCDCVATYRLLEHEASLGEGA